MTIYRPTVAQEMGGDHSINKALISSCELGVKKAQKGKGVNVDLHKELCGSLIKKECEYSFSVMHGGGDILNAFIRKHRTKQ